MKKDIQKKNIQVIFILGPTATGKSDFALSCAQNFQAEIINADSIQVYDQLDIGSAKPSLEDQKKVLHHLMGHIPVGGHYTAGKFRKEVLETIYERSKNGISTFFIVGGSGFYLKALIHGLYDIPEVSEDIQLEIKNTPISELYSELKQVDPESAKKIASNDSYRIARSMEVFRATGEKFSEFQKKFDSQKFPYTYFKVGLNTNKEFIRERVQKRVELMIQKGLLKETRAIMNKGYATWAPLMSVGYKESQMFIREEIKEEELVPLIVQNTMKLVKKQMTWFKKDSEIMWFDIKEGFDKPFEFVKSKLS